MEIKIINAETGEEKKVYEISDPKVEKMIRNKIRFNRVLKDTLSKNPLIRKEGKTYYS